MDHGFSAKGGAGVNLSAAASDDFSPALLDAAACREWIFDQLRGAAPCCPVCGVAFDEKRVERLRSGRGVACEKCGTKNSPRTGTLLEGSSLTDQQFVFILVLIGFEFPPAEIAEKAGCGRTTVYDWIKRLAESV